MGKEEKNWWAKYKKSPWWVARKDKFLANRPKVCEYCKSGDRLGVYHKHFNTLNREEDKDLELVCYLCWMEKNNKKKLSSLDREYRAIMKRDD